MAEKKWIRFPNPRYAKENWSEEMKAAAIEAAPSYAKNHTPGLYQFPHHEPWVEFEKKWMPLKHTEQYWFCRETGETVVHMVKEVEDDEITRLKKELADLKAEHAKLRQAIRSLVE